MRMTIIDRANAKASDFLAKTRVPCFKQVGKSYRGLVIEVDEEDAGDLAECLDRGGFYHDYEPPDESRKTGRSPRADVRMPKMPKIKPNWNTGRL